MDPREVVAVEAEMRATWPRAAGMGEGAGVQMGGASERIRVCASCTSAVIVKPGTSQITPQPPSAHAAEISTSIVTPIGQLIV